MPGVYGYVRPFVPELKVGEHPAVPEEAPVCCPAPAKKRTVIAVSADRLASNEEHDLFNAIFNANQTYKQFYEMTMRMQMSETVEEMSKSIFADKLSEMFCVVNSLCFDREVDYFRYGFFVF